MNETAHTPGPWGFEPSSGAIYYADGDVEPVIAGINQDGTSVEQADADGFLIAAAPDMLAALKAFNLKEEWIVSGTAETLTLRVPIAVIQQAAAAVAKASQP